MSQALKLKTMVNPKPTKLYFKIDATVIAAGDMRKLAKIPIPIPILLDDVILNKNSFLFFLANS